MLKRCRTEMGRSSEAVVLGSGNLAVLSGSTYFPFLLVSFAMLLRDRFPSLPHRLSTNQSVIGFIVFSAEKVKYQQCLVRLLQPLRRWAFHKGLKLKSRAFGQVHGIQTDHSACVNIPRNFLAVGHADVSFQPILGDCVLHGVLYHRTVF
jgi:hypothetical protein